MRKTIVYLVLLVTACGRDSGDVGLTVREEVRGDTTVVISSGDPAPSRATSVEVTWQSHELGNPQSMARVGEYLVVGDGYRVHVLDSEGAHQRFFGRSGEGPGELLDISSVGAFGHDTIAVFDGRLRRVSLYAPDGRFLGSQSAASVSGFLNASWDGQPLVRWGPGVLWTASGNVTPGQPNQLAAIWHDLDADSTAVLETWDDLVFEELTGGVFAPAEVFPSRAIVALGTDGRIAEGDGHEYCVRVRTIDDPETSMWCREVSPIRVESGIRSPDVALLGGDAQVELYEAIWEDQDLGEFLPHFDRLVFAESGDLWVRTYDEELSDIHPVIVTRRPDLAPAFREWEVFDSTGRLAKQVSLPFLFQPRVILDDRIFGFWPLETGEVTIGRVSLEEG